MKSGEDDVACWGATAYKHEELVRVSREVHVSREECRKNTMYEETFLPADTLLKGGGTTKGESQPWPCGITGSRGRQGGLERYPV